MSTIPLKIAALLTIIIGSTLLGCSATSPTKTAKTQGNYLIYGGDIITMSAPSQQQEQPTQAIWIKNGIIAALSEDTEQLKKKIGKDLAKVTQIDLKGKTLMPGFVEPHTHLPLIIAFSPITDLSPCLPHIYQYKTYQDENADCPNNWDETFAALKISNKSLWKSLVKGKSSWVLGNGVDPSRMGNSPAQIKQTTQFINNPSKIINDNKLGLRGDTTLPVLLVDQSGHVAYVNLEGFVASGLCKSVNECTADNNTIDNGNNGKSYCPDNNNMYCYDKQKVGGFAIDKNRQFTGRILEEPNYAPFVVTIAQARKLDINSPFLFVSESDGLKQAKTFIEKIATTGVTTLINAGGFKQSEISFFNDLVTTDAIRADYLNQPLMRFRTLISADMQTDSLESATPYDIRSLYTPVWKNSNNGLYGASGIKIWADGSTQGCSAYLNNNYAAKGVCQQTKGDQGNNYKDNQGLYEKLKPYWGSRFDDINWLIAVHANGDAAIKETLEAFGQLQRDFEYVTGDDMHQIYPVTLHHATVAGSPQTGENIIAKIPCYAQTGHGDCDQHNYRKLKNPLDISVSHTPAHIAYWGRAFESILDGDLSCADPDNNANPDSCGRTTTIDATQIDLSHDVAFSLHSDVPVSPINPLWYVQQVVTRDTWDYPHLNNNQAQSMPVSKAFGPQNVDVYQALRGITVVPAKQNKLFSHIGSIEKGKIADLVILDQNPLTVDKKDIHAITPCYTFVNGYQNKVYQNKDKKIDKCQIHEQ